MKEEQGSKVRVARTDATGEDLSGAIDVTVERAVGEEVKSVRVFGDCYRCNWWVREKSSQPVFLEFSTGRISKSRMLRVTREADRLVITDVSEKP
jgi:hypothetical protein